MSQPPQPPAVTTPPPATPPTTFPTNPAPSLATPPAPPSAIPTTNPTPSPRGPRWGEELPLFCEQCGYILHGMPQVRCETCDILQFHCPECGHHQPINTRRPAVQRAIARAGAWATGLLLLVKTNFFGWILFAWILFGYEWNRSANYRVLNPRAYGSYFDTEAVVLLMLLAAGFGAMGRMFVLRWRRGWVVGLVLAALTLSAAVGGMIWETSNGNLFPPGGDTPMMLAAIALAILAGAVLAWPTWCALALMLLPKRTSARLLDWQESLSDPPATRRSREPGTPV